jgi:hypothetical protein
VSTDKNAKNRKSSHVHDIILIEFDFPQGIESTIKIDMRALVLNLLKIESCLNTLDFILINLVFPQGIQICNQNCHAALMPNLLKIVIWVTSSGKRSKGLWMPQGSIPCSRNLNLGPGSQPAKNSKFLHVPWKKCHRA